MLKKYANLVRAKGWGALLHLLFVVKTSDGLVQFFRYGFVGGISAVADVGILYIATNNLHIFYLMSAAISFVVATLVNYALSVRWIFQSSGNTRSELLLFSLVGLGGLALTEILIGIQVEQLHMHYMHAKIVALAIVVLWSFSLRRLLFNRLAKKKAADTAITEE